MPRLLVGIGCAIVLAALSVLHVVWAILREPPRAAFIPAVESRLVFRPTPLATFAVGVGLGAAAVAVALQAHVFDLAVPPALARWSCGLVGAAFILRAIGEFRLVGFFKSVTGTRFARLDTWLYSPLCLVLGSSAIWLALS